MAARLQVAERRGLTKFVGRQAELEQMKGALNLARHGHGQIVAAIGEPGVGKSRLFFEFRAIAQSRCLVLEAYSVSHGKASAYLPVIELLKSYFKIVPEDDDRTRREKVNGKIITLDRSLEDTLPYLFGLLGIVEGDDPLAQVDSQLKRRRILEAVKRVLVRESLNQPLLVIFEDLHWIDTETQALLDLAIDGVATSRILVLVNYRPEYRHQWGNKTYYTQLRLDPLGRESADEMLAALLGDGSELAPLKRLIVERTQGNPSFIEEMVQALFEQGVLARNGAVRLAKPLSKIRVPPTVQAILASRIDRLAGTEKELLQTLAVLGREFSLGLIKRVTGKSEDELERMLLDLQLAEFIYEQPATANIEYTFKHALTQEVAYNSLLAERRRMLHERAGQAIEALFADRVEDHLTELAHHYERSGNGSKAVEYLSRTGARAAQQVAHAEAIGYLTRALELLRRLPDGAARGRQELDLQIALSWSLFVARRFRAPELESVLVRACELAEQLGEKAKLMDALLVLAYQKRHDLRPARELAERVLAMAEQATAPAVVAGAYLVLGLVEYASGQFPAARQFLERSVELFGAAPSRNYGTYFAQNARGMLMGALMMFGYLSIALSRAHELLAAARRSSDPYFIATALFMNGLIHLELRDTRVVAERADEMLSIATEHEMPGHAIVATFFRGWAMAAAGRSEEGIGEMRRSISDPGVPEGFSSIPLLVALAEICGKHRRVEEALDLVTEGLTTAQKTGVRMGEAELRRIKGELLMIKDPGNVAEAEGWLRTAIEVARCQGAKLYELRATTSLTRLLKQQGTTDESRQMLSEIYNWFTEGFEFADLKDARALLDELGG